MPCSPGRGDVASERDSHVARDGESTNSSGLSTEERRSTAVSVGDALGSRKGSGEATPHWDLSESAYRACPRSTRESAPTRAIFRVLCENRSGGCQGLGDLGKQGDPGALTAWRASIWRGSALLCCAACGTRMYAGTLISDGGA